MKKEKTEMIHELGEKGEEEITITMTRTERYEMEKRIYAIHSLAIMLGLDRDGIPEEDVLEGIEKIGGSNVISNMARLIQREAKEVIDTF